MAAREQPKHPDEGHNKTEGPTGLEHRQNLNKGKEGPPMARETENEDKSYGKGTEPPTKGAMEKHDIEEEHKDEEAA